MPVYQFFNSYNIFGRLNLLGIPFKVILALTRFKHIDLKHFNYLLFIFEIQE
mgnify:CR=1 FL=1